MSDNKEQEFSILPHPAKSNLPAESADDIEQRHGGLGGAPNLAHLKQAANDVTGGTFGLIIWLLPSQSLMLPPNRQRTSRPFVGYRQFVGAAQVEGGAAGEFGAERAAPSFNS